MIESCNGRNRLTESGPSSPPPAGRRRRRLPRLNEEQRHLAAEHERAARNFAYWLWYRSDRKIEVEEFIEAAYFALIGASSIHDPRHAVSFKAFLFHCIKWRILSMRYNRTWRKHQGRVCFSDLGHEDRDSLSIDPVDTRTHRPDERLESEEDFEKLRNDLPPHVWSILHARFLAEEPLSTIGRRLRIVSNVGVERMIDQAIRRAQEVHGIAW